MSEKLSVAQKRQLHIYGGEVISGESEAVLLNRTDSPNLANRIGELAETFWPALDTNLDTEQYDEAQAQVYAEDITGKFNTKAVFWLPEYGFKDQGLELNPVEALGKIFRKVSVQGMKPRKDIFAIGIKTTNGAEPEDQYSAGLEIVKEGSMNLVLARDIKTHNHMIVAPEETLYAESTDAEFVLRELLEMSYLRSQLSFTESTVVAGDPVPWNSEQVFPALREVVNYCIEHGAYKPFLGVTAGHFAAKIGEKEFLTSRRKTNFNNLSTTGLVKVVTDGPDRVVAFGSKPSVGGQSQRIVFQDHPDKDCIVHFHCPIKPGSDVPVVSQREYECGSHECGENTSKGLRSVDNGEIEVVYLDNHGPNIVFHHSVDPKKVIKFIEDNFDLKSKTGGYVPKSSQERG